MNRRSFLKRFGIGAGIAAAWPLVGTQVKEALAQVEVTNPETFYERPLLEGVPPVEQHDVVLYTPGKPHVLQEPEGIRWHVQKFNEPSKADPLGQFGFVALKWKYKGETYGDWVRYSWDYPTEVEEGLISELKHELLEKRLHRIKLIDKALAA